VPIIFVLVSLRMVFDGIWFIFRSRFAMILDLFPSSKLPRELLDTAANKESGIVTLHFVRAIWCAKENRTKPDLSRSATSDK
jgi:hypothetical protein